MLKKQWIPVIVAIIVMVALFGITYYVKGTPEALQKEPPKKVEKEEKAPKDAPETDAKTTDELQKEKTLGQKENEELTKDYGEFVDVQSNTTDLRVVTLNAFCTDVYGADYEVISLLVAESFKDELSARLNKLKEGKQLATVRSVDTREKNGITTFKVVFKFKDDTKRNVFLQVDEKGNIVNVE